MMVDQQKVINDDGGGGGGDDDDDDDDGVCLNDQVSLTPLNTHHVTKRQEEEDRLVMEEEVFNGDDHHVLVVQDDRGNLDDVEFTPIRPTDAVELKRLHEICFPVHYNDRFYEDLGSSLYQGNHVITMIARRKLMENAADNNNNNTNENFNGEILIGGITAQMKDLSYHDTEHPILSEESRRKGYHRGCYVLTLATNPEHRRGGIGSKLLKFVIDCATQDQRCGVVYLHVITYNTTAIQFYENHGFVQLAVAKDFYRIKGEYYDSFLYAKFLGPCTAAKRQPSIWQSIMDTVTSFFNKFFV